MLTAGGAERVAVSWANGLIKLGHQVEVLTDLDCPVTYELDSKVKLIPFDKFKPKSRLGRCKIINKFGNIFTSTKQLLDILNKSYPDVVVNVLYLKIYHLQLARFLCAKHIPVVWTDHNAYERPSGVKMTLRERLNKFVYNRFFDCVTVLTEVDKKILARKGITNVKVLHNPLFIEPCNVKPEKNKTILSIGRLNAWHYKGFDILMKAWKSVYARHPDWRLRVKGNHIDSIIVMLKEIAGESAKSIEFVPFGDNVKEEYRNASIYVLSSRYEGWGLVAVEAMSQGCAAIACNYNGRQAEYIEDGVNGLLCETGNPITLSEKICNLIENEDLRCKLQDNAINSVNKFREEYVAENLLEIIDEVIDCK